MTTETSLDKVYSEVKRVRAKLESIEKTLDSLRESLIPTEKVSPEAGSSARRVRFVGNG